MVVGFDTIGNATVICYDDAPILVTDPWIQGSAYFGSWCLQHEIPEEQLQAIMHCQYVWVSHGHPDHLSPESLSKLKNKEILLPDHVGSRIANDFRGSGYKVTVLKDRVWTQLSPRINVLCVADYNQDAILLADIAGTLLVNVNDAGERGWGHFVKKMISRYDDTVLLQLFGYGMEEVINFFDEHGERIDPFKVKRFPLGKEMASRAEALGVKKVIPFSSLHRYQRSDSAWANGIRPDLGDYAPGFQSRSCELLPAYVRYDSLNRGYTTINPPEAPDRTLDSKEFGDDWDETLDQHDFEKLDAYFRAIAHIPESMDFINFNVGGKDNWIQFLDKSHSENDSVYYLDDSKYVPFASVTKKEKVLMTDFAEKEIRRKENGFPKETPGSLRDVETEAKLFYV